MNEYVVTLADHSLLAILQGPSIFGRREGSAMKIEERPWVDH